MKNICVYHDDCLDGFASAYLVNQHLPDTEFIPGAYSSEAHLDFLFTRLHRGSYKNLEPMQLMLVDFSYPTSVIVKLMLSGLIAKLVIIDHHLSAIEELTKFQSLVKSIVDDNAPMSLVAEFGIETESQLRFINEGLELFVSASNANSGAGLVHKYFVKDKSAHPLIQFVEDRDLWKYDFQYTDVVCTGLASIPRTFDSWDTYFLETENVDPDSPYAVMSPKLNELMLMGETITRVRNQYLDKFVVKDSIQWVDILDYKDIPMLNIAGEYASNAGSRLNRMYAHKPFSITYFDTGLYRKYSLRSNGINSIDVKEVAKRFGGGGHKAAAGFVIKHINHPHPSILTNPRLYDLFC